jgi:hypothetical protein
VRRAELDQSSARWRWIVIHLVILLTMVARVWIIRHFPEPDGDAKGHLGIASALIAHPLNVALHWVWPPGYHYFLAALLAVGVTAQGVRLLNCTLAAILPILVWQYAERTLEPSASRWARLAPFLAGVFCAAMPIVNLLGTSAQQETLFTTVVLACVWSIDTRRFGLAGGLLAVATMIRYEACGAVGVLVGLRAVGFFPPLVRRLPEPLARACRLPLVLVVPALVTLVGWFVAHRIADGSWLGFLRELYRYTYVQRLSFHQDRWTDLFWFPITEPLYLFGLTLPLFFFGARRAWRTGFVVPLGIYLFLVASYTAKGVLGSARYYESVTPFVCIAAAHGAARVGERWRWALPLCFAAAFAHVAWLMLLLTGRWTFHVL